jgi:transcriptional regulator with XRE-family HTH domain
LPDNRYFGRVDGKGGRKRGKLRGESAETNQLAGILRDIADSHGRTLRDLAEHMPYSRTTISERLNGEARPPWDFVARFLEACVGGDRRAAAVLEAKVHPLWDAAAPRRLEHRAFPVTAVAERWPADVATWVTTMRETAAAQRVLAELQLSASRSMAIMQGLTEMVAKLAAASRALAEERDVLRHELLARSDSAAELLQTRALLEDTQRRLEVAEELLAQTSRRLDEANRQRTEAERLKDTASLQVASARRRLAAIEQYALAFVERVRTASEAEPDDPVLMGEVDQSVAAEVLSRVDDALGAEASHLDQLQGELASAASPVVRLSANEPDNLTPGLPGGPADPVVERYQALMRGKEHTAAVALQRSMLPGELPSVPGLTIDARYLPRSTDVGGDWYDVFQLPNRQLAVTVGDVMGRGLLAGAGMGRARNALRALALTDPRPAAVLSGLDRLFISTEREEQLTTVTYLVIDPETGEGHAGNAGHPPALLLPSDGIPVLDDAEASTPLGWASPRRQHVFRLSSGSTAVLYTNGLVENRRRGLDEGLDQLLRLAAEAPPDVLGAPARLLQYLLDNMLAGQEQDDDVTLLVMSRP